VGWIFNGNDDNVQKTLDMYDYGSPNRWSVDAIDFGNLAFDAFINNGEVDFENEVIIDETFKDSVTKCIHDLLKSNSNFYSDMLSNFSSDNARSVLELKIGTTINGDWGITSGSPDNEQEFSITTSSIIESNSSNLMKKVTLSHELIHAYMFSSLENWGLINYDVSGEPILNVVCVGGINYINLNLNTLDAKDRFIAIICAFNQNNTLSEQWTHDLFNVWIFDTNTYKDKLKDLLINSHNWNGENSAFKNEAISVFGVSNWIEEVANAVSWIGLEGTQEYSSYFSSYTNPLEQLYILDIRNKIQTAKSNCP